MSRITAPELPPGCPWSGWTPPNVNWCEEELCGWIVNPADTWSNLPFILLGALMWVQARRSGNTRVALFGPASIATGVASLVYHASYTWFFQFFDFVGMFLFACLLVAANAVRLGWIAQRRERGVYLAGVALMSALVPPGFEAGLPIQGLVFVLIVIALGQELAIRRREGPGTDYRSYFVAMAFLAAASTASALDVTRVWCDPANHWLQGHAVWHLLSACSLYALFRFYAALDEGRAAV